MGVPALAVRVRQPAAEVSQVVVALRPKDKMPVVGHQHERKNAYRAFGQRFGEHAQEGGIIGRFFKQRQARHSAVEDVVNEATRCLTRAAGHGGEGSLLPLPRQQKTSCVLFSFSLFFFICT
jgi:hypothetical protein